MAMAYTQTPLLLQLSEARIKDLSFPLRRHKANERMLKKQCNQHGRKEKQKLKQLLHILYPAKTDCYVVSICVHVETNRLTYLMHSKKKWFADANGITARSAKLIWQQLQKFCSVQKPAPIHKTKFTLTRMLVYIQCNSDTTDGGSSGCSYSLFSKQNRTPLYNEWAFPQAYGLEHLQLEEPVVTLPIIHKCLHPNNIWNNIEGNMFSMQDKLPRILAWQA